MIRPPMFFACVFLLIIGIVSVAKAQPNPPNIVLAIADDWGWPHAGVYGDKAVRTPAFDRIAREGVLCTNAYVSSPSCTPCRGSIITGQHFFRLGAGANLWCQWPEDRYAEYPRLLSELGYHVGTYRKSWGPGRGRNPAGKSYRSIDAFFDARPENKPFCLWFGSSDPHRPYKKGSGEASGIKLQDAHLFAHYPDDPAVRGDVADYYWEVQRFDRDVGALLSKLEAIGELDNTFVVVTGDHGMPFPRCKGNVYDSGARVPLALQWPDKIKGGARITDFVSLTDLAPTFLAAAGTEVPDEMTGRSLLGVLTSAREGRVDPNRSFVLIGRERHCPAQEASIGAGGYPVRAIRTDDFLYIRNFEPDRWPAGTPRYDRAFFKKAWLGDCDNGPTKMFLWEHRNDVCKEQFNLCFAKRPGEELYDLQKDPGQINNVAETEAYAEVKQKLRAQLEDELRRASDPRITSDGEDFDKHPYLGGAPQWPGEQRRQESS